MAWHGHGMGCVVGLCPARRAAGWVGCLPLCGVGLGGDIVLCEEEDGDEDS